MKIVFFPNPIKENPYQVLLCNSLRRYGAELEFKAKFSLPWLIKNRRKIDVVHFHWFWYKRENFFTFFEGSYKIIRVFAASLLGYRLVWTVHNMESHKKTLFNIDGVLRRVLSSLSHAIIVHGHRTKCEFERKFGRKQNVFVIPHGNYIGWYPNTVSRKEARERLKIPGDAFVYLYFGMIKRYKGVGYLIESFKSIAKVNDRLIIAGKTSFNFKPIEDSRIIYSLRFIEDFELQYYFNAADVAVFPFQEVTTSGSLMLALSFGKPIIAIDRGNIGEIVGDGEGYVLKGLSDLAAAMEKIKNQDLDKLSLNATAKAKLFEWDDIARKTFETYAE